MIKALFLIFAPTAAWERVVLAGKKLQTVFALYVLPMVVLSVGVELYGLLRLGRGHELVREARPIAHGLAIQYGAAQFALSLALVFAAALAIKACGETFHSRHRYGQGFTVAAYSLSPLFLVRMLDALPAMNPWITFAIGMTLSIAVLYSGIPRVMDPDPPHTFGLFLSSALLLAMIAGIARLVTWLLLEGRLKFV